MIKPSWGDVRLVFLECLKQPAEERTTFLADRCGEDQQLLAQVEELLQGHTETDDFLEELAHKQYKESLKTSGAPWYMRWFS